MKKLNLTYNNLKCGEFYVTFYPKQGKYIFRFGFPLWRREDKKNNQFYTNKNVEGNFTPMNGFKKFRLANRKEIVGLLNS